jgi:uroporphyrinogen-III decarboxylase
MDAVFRASLFVMSLALEEGIDFMSDSSYGLEMTSPALFRNMDLPYIQAFARWTREHGGLFWYHNCGFTSTLIKDGTFNLLGANVIETLAAPPEGDNDLAESRRALDRNICSKGNLNLTTLRDGTPEQITAEVHRIVSAVRGYPHIVSTADAVLPGTAPENFVAFVEAARAELGSS